MGLGNADNALIKRRLWNMLRVIIFLTRRCLLKRRHLHQDLTRRAKLFAHNFRNLMFHGRSTAGFVLREYEFSCSNSPALIFTSHGHRKNYLSCIKPNSLEEEKEYDTSADILQPANFRAVEETGTNYRNSAETYDLADGEELGTAMSHNSRRPCPVEGQIDKQAEEFIARFYNQMKFQRQKSSSEYEEMLLRGAS